MPLKRNYCYIEALTTWAVSVSFYLYFKTWSINSGKFSVVCASIQTDVHQTPA